jgi:hypothetical protein
MLKKKHLVCLEVNGALITSPTCHVISSLCCTLVARSEITCYARMQKKLLQVALYNGVHLISVWLLLSYQ